MAAISVSSSFTKPGHRQQFVQRWHWYWMAAASQGRVDMEKHRRTAAPPRCQPPRSGVWKWKFPAARRLSTPRGLPVPAMFELLFPLRRVRADARGDLGIRDRAGGVSDDPGRLRGDPAARVGGLPPSRSLPGTHRHVPPARPGTARTFLLDAGAHPAALDALVEWRHPAGGVDRGPRVSGRPGGHDLGRRRLDRRCLGNPGKRPFLFQRDCVCTRFAVVR